MKVERSYREVTEWQGFIQEEERERSVLQITEKKSGKEEEIFGKQNTHIQHDR